MDGDYRYIDPEAVVQAAQEKHDIESRLDAEFDELMQHVDFEVQQALEEAGVIEATD